MKYSVINDIFLTMLQEITFAIQMFFIVFLFDNRKQEKGFLSMKSRNVNYNIFFCHCVFQKWLSMKRESLVEIFYE